MSRFSQAISEGDGISVIPVLEGEIEKLAALAEKAGAEGIAVHVGDVARARATTGLPILARDGDPAAVLDAGGDALVVEFHAAENEGKLEQLYARSFDLGLDCAVEVREEEELEEALERFDPELFVLAAPDGDDRLEHVLDLLSDLPAGKLAIADLRDATQPEIEELERAGVDAVLVRELT